MSRQLTRGDLLPEIVVPPPGPESIAVAARLSRTEAPGVNTIYGGKPSIAWQEACGANVLDVDGNRYIDLTSGFGVALIGHRHPRVVEAVCHQVERLLHGLGDVAAHPPRALLAERLVGIVPVTGAQIYFAISGADAVEIALKTALLATGKPGVVAFDPGYHGTTLGALAVGSRDAFRAPFETRIQPHVHRLPYGCPVADVDRALVERPDVGALIVEPLVGREGVIVPPAGWLARIAARCAAHDVLMIADEIFTGFGRTGTLFAVDWEGVSPDLLCCGKALGGGMPIAAVAGRRELMAAWDTGGEALHTATFLAHPPACAAALAVLAVLEEEDLRGRSEQIGHAIESCLALWPDRFSAVLAVRGRGAIWGIELESRSAAAAFTDLAAAQGVLLLAGGPLGRVAQVCPPLTCTDEQLTAALAILEGAVAEI
jgi:4-aminobutyrate aminotransferase-like enzyme